jgi:hypothetical protein
MYLPQRPRVLGIGVREHVDTVLGRELQLELRVDLIPRGNNPRSNLRPNPINDLQLILSRSQHCRRRTESLQQRLPQEWPHA